MIYRPIHFMAFHVLMLNFQKPLSLCNFFNRGFFGHREPPLGSLNGEGRILLLHAETNHRRPLNVLNNDSSPEVVVNAAGFFLG